MLNKDVELGLWLFVGALAAAIMVGIVIGLCIFIFDFYSELKYINFEIGRTTGEERKHWKRVRRRLWLSLIPFVKYR